MAWTQKEASYALNHLISRRKVRMADVSKVLEDRKKEIQSLRRKLAELENLGGLNRRSAQARRKRKLSARTRSQLRLQGSYMGYVRRLTAAQKADVGKVRKQKGWRAAIAAAKRLAKK